MANTRPHKTVRRKVARSLESTASGTAPVNFPVLYLESLHEMIPNVFGALAIAGLWPLIARLPSGLWWLRFTALVLIIVIAIVITAKTVVLPIWVSVQNARIRRNWLRSFPRVIHRSDLHRLLETAPEQYRLHFKTFGTFGWTRPEPAYLLKDRTTRALYPIHPNPASSVVTEWEAAGLELKAHYAAPTWVQRLPLGYCLIRQ